jgi:hypothetical protein
VRKKSEKQSIHNSFKEYLEIKLPKEVEDFYNKSYEPLKKEIEEDTRR